MIDTARPKPNSLTDKFLEKLSALRTLQIPRTQNSAKSTTESTTKSTTQSDSGQTTLPGDDILSKTHLPGGILSDDLELAQRILARIEDRLPGRIRELTVYTTDNAVILTGQCSTFYSKQLAQHAAMGILEYERLINNINVRVPL